VGAESPQEAEQALARYPRGTKAYPKASPNGSLAVVGAGWYRLERDFKPSR
jgi:hypothetical protein